VTLVIERADGLTLHQVYRPREVFAVEVTSESDFPKAEEAAWVITLPFAVDSVGSASNELSRASAFDS
jgi:hypothetical protein